MPTNADRSGTLNLNTASSLEVSHDSPRETIKMEKYHLLWVIEGLNKRPRGPSFEQVVIPITFCLGFVITLVTVENYKDFLGISKDTWHAVMVLGAFATGIIGSLLAVWWAFCRIRYPRQSSEQVVDAIIERMAKDREQAELRTVALTPAPSRRPTRR